jgi:hypothetical protein
MELRRDFTPLRLAPATVGTVQNDAGCHQNDDTIEVGRLHRKD